MIQKNTYHELCSYKKPSQPQYLQKTKLDVVGNRDGHGGEDAVGTPRHDIPSTDQPKLSRTPREIVLSAINKI